MHDPRKHVPKKEKTEPRTWNRLVRAYNAREWCSRCVFRLVGFSPREPGVESVSANKKDVEWISKTSRRPRRRRELLLLPTPLLSLLCPRYKSSLLGSYPHTRIVS